MDVGHAGPRLRTATLLDLRADHAIARDAVWDDTDCSVADDLGFVTVQTLVNDKEEYLRRPDLARGFSDESLAYLRRHAAPGADLQIIAADGLSVAAVQENLARIYPELIRLAGARGYSTGTPIYVRYGRVATMDKISEALQAKVTVLLVGERPGLGCRTSMSCYMAWEASPDKPEAQRNVVSNIHDGGLPPEAAAERIISIAADMFRYRTSGVELNRLLHRVAR
ncbi:MAG: ethanolamine ammonia-lyase subunit EutC [Actinomycetes bacterium]|nr:ethanolamine ammonia-lyase subunit EutC [Actinomycetes bacterium]